MSLLTFIHHGQAKICEISLDLTHTHTAAAYCRKACVWLESRLKCRIYGELQHTCLFTLIHPSFHRSSFQHTHSHTCSLHTPSPSSYSTLIRVSQLKQKSSHWISLLQSTDFTVIWPANWLSEQSREKCHFLLFLPIKTLQTYLSYFQLSGVCFTLLLTDWQS